MTGAFVCPPDHAHAESQTCHSSHGCRCDDCRQAHTEYEFYRRGMIRAGRWTPRMSTSSRGVRRRLQALMTLGWSQSELARRLGTSQSHVWNMLERSDVVDVRTAERVAALYDELWNVRAVGATRGERVSVSHAIGNARRRGYLPPLAWDDIDADDEPGSGEVVGFDEVAVMLAVDGIRTPMTEQDYEQAVRVLHARGHFDTEIARILRCSPRTVLRHRQALGLESNVDQSSVRPSVAERRAAA